MAAGLISILFIDSPQIDNCATYIVLLVHINYASSSESRFNSMKKVIINIWPINLNSFHIVWKGWIKSDRMVFQVWLRSQLISAGLKLVVIRTE